MNRLLLFGLISTFFIYCTPNTKKSARTSKKTYSSLKKDTLLNHKIKEIDFISTEFGSEKLIPIRKYVAYIDSLDEWSLVLSKEIDQTPMKGKVTFYVWKTEILKTTTNQSNKKSNKYSQYYTKNGQLIFVYEKEFDFKNSFEIITESYYENGKLIRSLDNQDCGAPYNDEYHQEEQKRIDKDMKKLMKLYIK